MPLTADFNPSSYSSQIRTDGCALVASVLPSEELSRLVCIFAAEASRPDPDPSHSRRAGSTYALRNVLELLGPIPESPVLLDLVRPILGPTARVVRGILFDKIPRANWAVGWHQDTVIPAAQRVDLPGYGPWSIKAGVPHVQPPVHILESMLTLRIHLDDCNADNGPLEVIPGSHLQGFLEPEQVKVAFSTCAMRAITCTAGDVFVMRPLLLHSSRPARTPGHRRVLHLEYAGVELPSPLQWPRR